MVVFSSGSSRMIPLNIRGDSLKILRIPVVPSIENSMKLGSGN